MDFVYRAFDGTIFEDEDDCTSYERNKRLERYKDTVRVYDIGNDLTDFGNDNLYRITFADKETKESFYADEDLSYFLGGNTAIFEQENDYLDFYYDMDEERWIAVEEKYEQLSNELKEFCKEYGLTKYCGW